jgi:periplasmic divalent cation tolerance protein
VKISFLYIPVGNETDALKLGTLSMEAKLAGCMNVFPIQSAFPWDGKMQHEKEFVLLLKTLPAFTALLQKFILEKHHYELPCIASWEVEVNEAYGQWLSGLLISPASR